MYNNQISGEIYELLQHPILGQNTQLTNDEVGFSYNNHRNQNHS